MSELVVQLAEKAGAGEVLARQVSAKQAFVKQAFAKQVFVKRVFANEDSENEVPEKEVSAKKAPAKKASAKKAVGKKAIAIILGSLRNEGVPSIIQALIDKIPDAEAATEAPGSGSGLVGLLGGRLMAQRGKLIGLGLSMGRIQSVISELLRLGRDRVAADRMGEIIAGTPGFRQLS